MYELFATTLYSSTEWTIDNTNIDGKYYSFYANSGSSYTVSWLDPYNGNNGSDLSTLLQDNGINESGVDVKVSIYFEDGMYEVCNDNDSGPQNFTAPTTGYYIIKVEPYYSGSTGYFAVKVE